MCSAFVLILKDQLCNHCLASSLCLADSPVNDSEEQNDDQFGKLFERFGAMKGMICFLLQVLK